MIPKIIHYCWFGGNPLPELAQRCIASWRKFLPEYKIREWNESNFDVNVIPYTAEAYRLQKYAFVSDYARFWILYRYGGIYFDTDVEVIRPMDDIIDRGNFMGFEQDPDGENTPGKYAPRYCFGVNPGIGFGIIKEHPFLKQMLDLYATLSFQPVPENIAWYKTIVAYTTEELCRSGLRSVKGIQNVRGINIYPRAYFSPINVITSKCTITEQTYSIHRFTSTWSENKSRNIKDYLRHYLPEWVFYLVNHIKRKRYRIK